MATLDAPSEATILDALVRKGLIVEDEHAAEATGFRFKHLLIRDAAYGSLPKAERGQLHERFGLALEREMGDRAGEVIEILAHHAERAFTIAVELRAPPAVTAARAERALDHAVGLAGRALTRGDAVSAARFVETGERAVAAAGVRLDDARALRLGVVKVEQLAGSATPAELAAAAGPIVERAIAAGHRGLAAKVRLVLYDHAIGAYTGAPGELERLQRDALETIALFERAGDAGGAIAVQMLMLESHWAQGRLSELLAHGESLLARAVAAGDRPREAAIAARLAAAATLSADGARADRYRAHAERLTEELGIAPSWWQLQGRAGGARARSQYATAEKLYLENVALAEEWGARTLLVGVLRSLADLYLELGRIDDAHHAYRAAVEESERLQERWTRTEALAGLGLTTALRGDLAAGERILAESGASARADDVAAVWTHRAYLARLRVLQGRDAEAESLFREALAIARGTEFVVNTMRVELDFAEFLASHGRATEAASLLSGVEALVARSGYDLAHPQRERIRAALASVGA